MSSAPEVAFAAFGPHPPATITQHLCAADIRLHNRDELIGALRADSKTLDDAGLFAAAWEKWGKDSLQRIVGDYAVAVYDREARRLTLARDPTGQVPLFFKSAGSAIAFASMPCGLTGAFRPSRVNQAQVARFLMRQQLDLGESYFEDIYAVRPGEIVEFRDGLPSRDFHWQPSLEPISRDADDYVERYRALLDLAVASRAQNRQPPIGAQLSSGWDSSAVATTAARLLGGDHVIAYTAAPYPGADTTPVRHRHFDESGLAAATAQMHGLKHVIVREGDPVLQVAQKQSALTQEPVASPFNMVWWTEILRRAREDGVRTLLTGELGNLSLNMGGLYALEDLVRHGRLATWMREAIRLTRRHDVRLRGVLFNSFQPWIPEKGVSALFRAFLAVPAPEETSFLRRHQLDRIAGAMEKRPFGLGFRENILRSLRQVDYGTRRKAALAEGIEECDPLSDRRIIEFALRLPVDQIVNDGQSRPLARRALSDRVPAAVLDARWRGLQGADWHLRISQGEARNALEEIAGNAMVRELLDVEKMSRAIDSWPSANFNELFQTVTYRNGLVNALLAGIFVMSHASPDNSAP